VKWEVHLKHYEKLTGEAGASPELSFLFKNTSGASPELSFLFKNTSKVSAVLLLKKLGIVRNYILTSYYV
jgi:hypothetical protein